MNDKIYNVLFLCTGNSARSIMAECLLNRLGNKRFKAYSAVSMPKGEIHTMALHVLRRQNFITDSLRSKSWDEFSGEDAPELDFVFTLCDSAKNEVCPVWPGQPMTAHWGMPDPAVVEGSHAEQMAAFNETMRLTANRIGLFTCLPIKSIDRLSLQNKLDEIGQQQYADSNAA